MANSSNVNAVADTTALRDGSADRADGHAEGDQSSDGDVGEAESDGDRRDLAIADADEPEFAAGAAGGAMTEERSVYYANNTYGVADENIRIAAPEWDLAGGTHSVGTMPNDDDPLIMSGDPLPDEPVYVNYCIEARQRIQQLEDALLAVVRRMAVLERKMEAMDGQGARRLLEDALKQFSSELSENLPSNDNYPLEVPAQQDPSTDEYMDNDNESK